MSNRLFNKSANTELRIKYILQQCCLFDNVFVNTHLLFHYSSGSLYVLFMFIHLLSSRWGYWHQVVHKSNRNIKRRKVAVSIPVHAALALI